jgi:hypothetical protein
MPTYVTRKPYMPTQKRNLIGYKIKAGMDAAIYIYRETVEHGQPIPYYLEGL